MAHVPMPSAEPEVLHYAAFTLDGAGGNPAGVVLDADDLEDGARLALAAALGYSESAFVDRPESDGSYRVRYFSPLDEVPFCGHATIAAAVALAGRGATDLVLRTRVGAIPVQTGSGPELTATLTSPPTSTRPALPSELRPALAALHWRADELDPAYPPHVANGGNDHLVLAVRDRERLARLEYDYEALAELMAERSWITLQLVQAETPVLFHARNPFPPGGVVEDPATGAAAAAFGGYLRALGRVDVPGTVTILQGEDMGRPSRLTVQIPAEGDRVLVSGSATLLPDPGPEAIR